MNTLWPHSRLTATMLATTLLLAACQSPAPMPTVDRVDLPRFMGDWYVIANIPTWIEQGAHNAVESYALNPDGSIATTFTFNKDRLDGPQKRFTPRGFVLNKQTNAIWGMRFVWPIKADYRIIYLNDAYTQTVIGRQARDYLWIMARTPTLPDADYQALVTVVSEAGYDVSRLHKVPQNWEHPNDDGTR